MRAGCQIVFVSTNAVTAAKSCASSLNQSATVFGGGGGGEPLEFGRKGRIEAVHRQRVDVHVTRHVRRDLAALPGQNVERTLREIARRDALGEDDRGARIFLRRERDDGVAGDERWNDG